VSDLDGEDYDSWAIQDFSPWSVALVSCWTNFMLWDDRVWFVNYLVLRLPLHVKIVELIFPFNFLVE
jgi:hypothetical protein